MVIVIAKFKALPNRRDEVIAVAAECVEATRREEGCLSYELFTSVEDAERFVFVEKWATREALERHAQSDHLKRFAAARQPFVAGPSEVESYDTK